MVVFIRKNSRVTRKGLPGCRFLKHNASFEKSYIDSFLVYVNIVSTKHCAKL